MIIITADHGESFGEHNLMDHGRALYEELIKIPLIIKYPSSLKIGAFESPVSLLDIMPTVLSTVGIPLSQNIQWEVITNEVSHRKLYAESYRDKLWIEKLGNRFDRDLLAVYSGDFKYIWASNGKHQLYNLGKDPNESQNLIHEMPKIVANIDRELKKRLPLFKSSRSINESPQVDNAIKEKLRALGYI
jgi:arylsulfatase A-like enzyme